jgi:uncharacterized membrane protein YeaQ/YmgE (transglycosylase-associated protein family)
MVSKTKSLMKDSLIAIPITCIYLLFVHRVIELLTENLLADEKFKKNIILSFVIGIVGILLGIYVFGKTKVANRSVKFALVLGSIIMIIYSLYNNWEHLQSDSKLFIIGGVFALTIGTSYFI